MYKSNHKRLFLIFFSSFMLTTVILLAWKTVTEYLQYHKMLSYALASRRESDGAENLVIMNGVPGYIGESQIYLQYLQDGYIRLFGYNPGAGNACCKKISEFSIPPGKYSLSGVQGMDENTVALQLRIDSKNVNGQYFFQYNQDLQFVISEESNAILQVRIGMNVTAIDVVLRPAVYRDE